MKESILRTKSFHFSKEVIFLCKQLQSEKEFILSNQLMRSGTSIGANIREAKNAQSNKDFINKLSISQKECDETMYWLELLNECGYLEDDFFNPIYNKSLELMKMISKSIDRKSVV